MTAPSGGEIAGEWLASGEHDLGVAGRGYLQGVFLTEASAPKKAIATDRRVVLLASGSKTPDATGTGEVIEFEVAWSQVRGYWTGTMRYPPEMWRQGPEGDVVVLSLDPAAAGGHDLVIVSNTAAWAGTARAMGVTEIRD